MMDELPKKNYLKVVPNAWPAKLYPRIAVRDYYAIIEDFKRQSN